MPASSRGSAAAKSARDKLIEAAAILFCRRGFNAVGVDAIVDKAGTAKATLYKLFGSKEQLVEAVLEIEGREWRDWFMTAVNRGGSTADERLRTIFPVLEQWFRQRRFYGCPFINAVAEHDKSSDRMRQLALAHKMQVLAFIKDLCVGSGVPDPDQLTHEIAILIDGAIVAAMITKDPTVAATAQRTFSGRLDALSLPAAAPSASG